MSAVIQTSAYCKIFLHAAKYSSSAIGGYIIGTGNSDQINITDIVPICHNNPCGPMFEIAAEMVSSSSLFTTTSYHLNTHEIWTLYATSQTESLFAGTQSRVLGYYFANETATSTRPAYIENIVKGISNITGGSCLLLEVQNDLISKDDALVIKVLVRNLMIN